ncbi:MAG: M14 family zinc carboxypeptidase, partial [Candidatus Thermoplasmatota archaeon]|nr:M14 family zinc carboxypeptidase [Candidatus Thermoplasmatota archaeon]
MLLSEVRLLSAGNGSSTSSDNKADGTAKEKVYIDGGHHGNEHLGTELAFLTAEFYIEGWADGDSEAIEVLQ